MLTSYTKRFPAQLSELDSVLDYVACQLEKADCSLKASTSISICLEEAFVNIANYAYPEGGGEVELDIVIDDQAGTVQLSLSDGGIPFDPLAKDDPDVSLDAEQRKIGGLGIFMVKKMMDSVNYEFKNGKNILSMKKSMQ